MEVKNTLSDSSKFKPTVNMLVYGHPGTGKTTFASRSEGEVLIADCESGSNLLGMRGIGVDVAQISDWDEINEVLSLAQSGVYSTVVLDPLGELLNLLLKKMKKTGYGANGGDVLNIQGWGVAKDKFMTMIRTFRDLPVHLVCTAHSSETNNNESGGILIRPQLAAKLGESTCAAMNVVGYLRCVSVGDGKEAVSKRELYTSPTEVFYAKDRTGMLPSLMDDDPNFEKVKNQVLSSDFFKKKQKHEHELKDFEKSLDGAEKNSLS